MVLSVMTELVGFAAVLSALASVAVVELLALLPQEVSKTMLNAMYT
jgi:hypothetical protein